MDSGIIYSTFGGERDIPTAPEVAQIRESSLGSCDSGRNLFRNAAVSTDAVLDATSPIVTGRYVIKLDPLMLRVR